MKWMRKRGNNVIVLNLLLIYDVFFLMVWHGELLKSIVIGFGVK